MHGRHRVIRVGPVALPVWRAAPGNRVRSSRSRPSSVTMHACTRRGGCLSFWAPSYSFGNTCTLVGSPMCTIIEREMSVCPQHYRWRKWGWGRGAHLAACLLCFALHSLALLPRARFINLYSIPSSYQLSCGLLKRLSAVFKLALDGCRLYSRVSFTFTGPKSRS